MKRALIVTGCILGGYVIGAVGGYWATFAFSPNRHDLALEAAMSAAFAYGPAAAALGAIIGFVVARKPPAP